MSKRGHGHKSRRPLVARRGLIALLMALTTGLSAVALAGFARDDESRFQGTWELVSMESNGAPFDPGTRGTLLVRGDQAKLIVQLADQKIENAYRLQLNPLHIPPAFDVHWEDGRITRGIYKFSGDELIRCHGQPDGARPAVFEAPPGTGQVLSIWRRPPSPEEDAE